MKKIAAGGLVFNDKNELLMIYRRGKWDLPKGHLDKGETLEECAVREVGEETGLVTIHLHEKIGITLHEYIEEGIAIEKETHWYRMTVSGVQDLQPQIEEDIVEIRWVVFLDLSFYLANTYENIRQIILQSGW